MSDSSLAKQLPLDRADSLCYTGRLPSPSYLDHFDIDTRSTASPLRRLACRTSYSVSLFHLFSFSNWGFLDLNCFLPASDGRASLTQVHNPDRTHRRWISGQWCLRGVFVLTSFLSATFLASNCESRPPTGCSSPSSPFIFCFFWLSTRFYVSSFISVFLGGNVGLMFFFFSLLYTLTLL